MLPPLPLTNILQFATIKSFRNESFLRQKYFIESASLDEIAALTLSSRKTVRRYLLYYQIALKPEDQLILGQEFFGARRVKGVMTADPFEMAALAQMKDLREQGCSYRTIVERLNTLKIPCRKPGAKWHLKTVHNILNRKIKLSSSDLGDRSRI